MGADGVRAVVKAIDAGCLKALDRVELEDNLCSHKPVDKALMRQRHRAQAKKEKAKAHDPLRDLLRDPRNRSFDLRKPPPSPDMPYSGGQHQGSTSSGMETMLFSEEKL